MQRDDRGVVLFLSIAVAFYFASLAFADKSAEDLRQAAYEQVEGRTSGGGVAAAAAAPAFARSGIKASPAPAPAPMRARSLRNGAVIGAASTLPGPPLRGGGDEGAD